jgi:glycine cleavage system H protein
MATFAQDRLYAKTHEWVKIEDDAATCGISDYAQEQLNDVVYVELPEVGDSFKKGDTFAVIESVKAASDIYMPLGGKITAVNDALVDSPQLVNESAFDNGWLIKFTVANRDDAKDLLDAAAYEQFCSEEGA